MSPELALEAKTYVLNIYEDSQLIIRQMNLEYEVRKPNFVPYFNQTPALKKKFKVCEFHYVPKQSHIKADALIGLSASMNLVENYWMDLQVVQRRLLPLFNTHETNAECFRTVGDHISAYENSFKDCRNVFMDYNLHSILPKDPQERLNIQR